jgi:hypothetical protein
VEIERELTQATDDYLRGKIKLDELNRLEEKYRPQPVAATAPSREPPKDRGRAAGRNNSAHE